MIPHFLMDGSDMVERRFFDDALPAGMMAEAQERYEILRQIHDNGPVGRHLLAMQTKLSENTVRKHIEKMEESGLLFLVLRA